jgi:MFS family permease
MSRSDSAFVAGSLLPAYGSISVFVFGHGLLSTWLIVRVAEKSLESYWLGLLTAAYFVGLISGSFINCHLLARIGHIRAYAAYASVLSIIALAYGMWDHPLFWVGMRLLGGFATGGLVLVIESWMLVNSQPHNRGRVMAVYMCLFYGFLALGQFCLGQIAAGTLWWVSVITAIAVSLSVLPLVLTSSPAPETHVVNAMSLRDIFSVSPAGAFGAFGSGVILGVSYGYFPAYLIGESLSRETVGAFVAIITVGGMALQYPLGKLSDHMDRRKLLVAVTLAMALMLLVLDLWLLQMPYGLALVALFLLGGMAYCLYPISVSHTCDELPKERIVSANQALLVAYAAGSICGPLVLAVVMTRLGTGIYFEVLLLVSLVMGGFFLVRLGVRHAVVPREQKPYSAAPPNTPLAAEIDPRGGPS